VSYENETLQLRDEVAGLRARLAEAEHRVSKAEGARVDALRALDDMRAEHNEALVDLQQVKRERDAILELRSEVTRLHRQIQEIHRSRTWRIGRMVLLPIRVLRRVKRLASRQQTSV